MLESMTEALKKGVTTMSSFEKYKKEVSHSPGGRMTRMRWFEAAGAKLMDTFKHKHTHAHAYD